MLKYFKINLKKFGFTHQISFLMIFVEAHASGFKEEFVKKTPLNNFLPCEGAEAHPSQPS